MGHVCCKDSMIKSKSLSICKLDYREDILQTNVYKVYLNLSNRPKVLKSTQKINQ